MRQCIFNTLEDLGEEDFETFKWCLQQPDQVNGLKGIPLSQLERASRTKTTDLIMSSYAGTEAQIMVDILTKINKNNLVLRFTNTSKGMSSDVVPHGNTKGPSQHKVTTMAMLKGETMTLVNVGEVKTVQWKQGSILGFGGDKTQVYHECAYKMQSGCQLPVYIQVGFKVPPKSLKIDGTFQFGMNNGVLFLVLHGKSQTPYQHRFMMNPKQQWLSSANEFLKIFEGSGQCVDLSWIAGDYLRNL